MNYDSLDGTGRKVQQSNAKPTDKSPLALIMVSHQHHQAHTCVHVCIARRDGERREETEV